MVTSTIQPIAVLPIKGMPTLTGGHQEHGVGRRVSVVELGKAAGKNTVAGGRQNQAAQGPQIADQAGQNQRQQRGHQHRHAEVAHIAAGGIERRQPFNAAVAVQIADVVQPACAAVGIG